MLELTGLQEESPYYMTKQLQPRESRNFLQKQMTVEFPRKSDYTASALHIHEDELREDGKEAVLLVCDGRTQNISCACLE